MIIYAFGIKTKVLVPCFIKVFSTALENKLINWGEKYHNYSLWTCLTIIRWFRAPPEHNILFFIQLSKRLHTVKSTLSEQHMYDRISDVLYLFHVDSSYFNIG